MRTDNDLRLAVTDRAALVAELDAAGARWASNGKDCHCPFHDDQTPSAGIFEADDGHWLFKCFPCDIRAGDLFDVRARRLNQPLDDVLRAWRAERQPSGGSRATGAATAPASDAASERVHLRHYADLDALEKAACYDGPEKPPCVREQLYKYVNPDTNAVELIVFRLVKPNGSKTFRQASPDGSRGWVLRGPAGAWPLFNRRKVKDAGDVILVEGEKCVEHLQPLLRPGWAAATNAGGAETGKAELTDWSPLAGKRVWLWPDNDPPEAKRGDRRVGVEHMKRIADALARLTPQPEIFWIDVDCLGLPPKGDVVDFIAKCQADGRDPLDAINDDVLRPARPIRPSAKLRERYERIAAGELVAVPWPWPILTKFTQALTPGSITMLCGEPGAGKSFAVVECLWYWLHAGYRATCLMLESEATFHANRLHAQLASEPGLLNMDWVKANATRVDELYHQHAASLDRFFGSLDVVPPDKDVLPGPVLDWLYKRFRAGARLALVDPITAISGDKPWVTDKEFLQPARRLCEDYGASLVLATHPARGGKQMAGSEAMRRFVDSVVWLIQHRPPKVESVRTRYGSTLSQRFNRTVRVTKSRFAAGPPGDLAYDFDGAGLRFAELGLIVEDDGSGNDAAPLPVEPEPDLTSSDVPPEPFVVPAPQPETEEPL